jgi:Protein of unknown function (DUF2958)
MTPSEPLEPLLTVAILQDFITNGKRLEAIAQADDGTRFDPRPVVKLFTPNGNATWLLTEADPTAPDRMFGLFDLGLGEPELGWCSLREVAGVRGPLGLVVERDRYFHPTKTHSAYAAESAAAGRIVT